ncbi:MAG: phage protease [Candidatus Acidoferrales bacterium]|nr:phage protease [Candidatus Acidoferrales bacterium]
MNPTLELSTESLLCRARVALAPTATGELMYMPAGVQTISPMAGGIGQPIKVLVDRDGAAQLEEQRAALHAQGKRPYFDFNHEDGEASFWPEAFLWKEEPAHSAGSGQAPGIYARGEWTEEGRAKVEGKAWRQFSPVFHVDNKRGDPARIVARAGASPNMGGLVNNPAFHAITPLWAKGQTHSAGAAGQQQQNHNQIQIQEMDTTTENDAAALQAKVAELQQDLRARNRADALAAVRRAVERGALAAKDQATHDALVARGTDDAAFLPIIDALQGHALSGPITARSSASTGAATSAITLGGSDPRDVFRRMGALCAKQHEAGLSLQQKAEIAREFAAVYASEFRGANAQRMFDSPLKAADYSDPGNNLGTLSGTLVTQRTLELLKLQFPALTRFTSDFSDQPAQFNQTIMTRTIGIPTAADYDPTAGWGTGATAQTFDVPVTISKHKGIPITFNSNILASTSRRLFEEFGPAQAYGLGLQMVTDLYANITDANFTNNSTPASSGVFSRKDVIGVGTALTLRGVPEGDAFRTMLLYPTTFASLAQDSSLVTFASFQRPDLFEKGRQMSSTAFAFPVHGFDVHEASNLPTNGENVTGFAGSRSALIIATRLPNDYTSVLPGASYGNASAVVDPDTGITVMLVQYVDHKLGTATQRIAIMYGTAAGQGNAGQIIKSASGTGTGRI